MLEKKLYIVGTPIGNLNDITLRALETLKHVDVIACEDTRVTSKLLAHFDIKNKKLIAYHNFNEKNSSKGIIDMIQKEGIKVALVSDAGMPMIADPGYNLINDAISNGIEFEIIPGVSALTTAIAASGFGNDFTFLGFGKPKKGQLENQVKELRKGTYIFFSAPHKVLFLLEMIKQHHSNNHQIFLGREMTKKFETFYYGNADEIITKINNNLKGEITLVLKITK